MKLDVLEKFIIEKTHDFDDLEPRDGLFLKVKTRKLKSKMFNLKFALSAAAVIVILLTIGFFMNNEYSNIYKSAFIYSKVDSSYREFYEMQTYYTSQIEQVKNEILAISIADKDIKNDIDQELKMLNDTYRTLQDDFDDNMNDKDVLKAMIMNYRVSLKTLEDLKEQIQPTISNNTEEPHEIFNS